MRELWHESWLARHGIESLYGEVKRLARNDSPRLKCNENNLVLGISMDRV
jgi:hypothetical protein